MSNLSNKKDMKNKYQLLANKWKNQADKSSNEQEQMWLYACSADLKSLIQQSNNQITQTQEKSKFFKSTVFKHLSPKSQILMSNPPHLTVLQKASILQK